MCGIIGILNQKEEAFPDLYEGLLMLQHRGQDGAGIVTYDEKSFSLRKSMGLVRDVFHQGHLKKLKGTVGIGHVRYPTAGSLNGEESQPFYVNAPFGMYLVHNGNLVHIEKLRKNITNSFFRHLETTSDSELLLNILADNIYKKLKSQKKEQHLLTRQERIDVVFQAVTETIKMVSGAYSVIVLINQIGMLVFRDPHGIRPLSIGERNSQSMRAKDYAFASEDVAFDPLRFKKTRDVQPGEAVLIEYDGTMHTHQYKKSIHNPCIFEYIYLARPDSMIDEISVYKTQLRLGQALAKQIKKANLDIDSVIPIPESSRPAALEISVELGLRYREGLVKNRYVGRTFIMPEQSLRRRSVRRKLNTIPLEFKNKNILLVDDSIVRGTTISEIVEMCRESGAKKVYVASAAPPVRYPNVYGVDMPSRKELIASGLTISEIEKTLGIDKLFYQTLEDLITSAKFGNPNIKKFDCSCFDGEYVTGDIDEAYLDKLEKSRKAGQKQIKMSLINL